MSKYWQNMFVDHTIPQNKGKIISYEEPSDITHDYTLTESIKDIASLCHFVNIADQTSSGNTTMLTADFLKKLIKYDINTFTLYDKELIIGFVLNLPLPCLTQASINKDKKCNHHEWSKKIDINNQKNIIIGCTSFLCLHPEYRKQGLAMILIKAIIAKGHKYQSYAGYHLVSEIKTKTAVELNMWYRVIDLNLAPKYGYNYVSYRKKSDKNNFRDKLKYTIKLTTNITIRQGQGTKKELIDYQKIIKQYSQKKFVFYPNLIGWQEICDIFDCYLIYDNNIIVGVFILHNNPLHVRSVAKTFNNTLLLLMIGQQPITLKSIIFQCQERKDILLYMYQNSNITEKDLTDLNCLLVKSKAYFERYNHSGLLQATDVETILL